MIQDYFCNEITVKSRNETTVYEDGISKKVYTESCNMIKCRISHLSYRDLQLLQGIDDIQVKVQKLYVMPEVEIKPTDYIVREGKEYQVISSYLAQDKTKIHHRKYFIKLVE